ncbi:Structural maintenance of chromosomes protein 5 [Anabarilius grahami]|uniref:Structural maintenance of chromosomes protein 5 n=1 Tax=Anabarilius grahami TaxID=495550 RepID=A0A3N0ZBI9_ANAGA|nr:Structural maintenance of chromosomes protein 5 [Anabarilius grahami]
MEVAHRSGLLSYQCMHVRSVSYCKSSAEAVSLKEDVLTEMVRAKWFGEEKKKNMPCSSTPFLAVYHSLWKPQLAAPKQKKFISVFEPNVFYYSRLGRVIVVYNTKLNTWHCPCSKVRRSCTHKHIAKWHLFQTDRELFRTVFSREESPHQKAHKHSEESDITEDHPLYPPHDLGLKQMVQYILQHKRIPAVLPDNIRVPSPGKEYPKYLCPEETICQRCPVSDIEGPAENFNVEVNLEQFWGAMSCDMIGRGFVASNPEEPFSPEEPSGTEVVMEHSSPTVTMVSTGANSYVVVTWLPPFDLDPFLSFPDDIATKDCVSFPAWKLGHWMLDQVLSENDPDEKIAQVGRITLQRKDFGPWDSVQSLRQQKHAAVDVQVPLSQHDTQIADKEPQIVKDLLAAVGWLRENCNALRGRVEEPWYLTLNKEDPEKALLQLDQAEKDEDRELAKEPFMFRLFPEDMDVFIRECRDKRLLRINSMFMEFDLF